MTRGYVAPLLLLAAIWGSSFMFIEIALRELSPAATMTGRLLFAALALGSVLVARRGPRQALYCLRQFGWAGLVLGVITTALPFWLIAWGQTRIDSGIAAIGNASMPIFVALLAIRFARHERVAGLRALGLVVGQAERAVEWLVDDARQVPETNHSAGRIMGPWKLRHGPVVTFQK